MTVVAGLGNPGEEYRYNRHNIGFMIIDKFADSRKLTFKKEGNALNAKRNRFTLVKPLTYMNLSGKAISMFADDLNDLLVVCDDIYLPLGEIRLRKSGGDGGHNGLWSIIDEFDSVDFCRMRIGVGLPKITDETETLNSVPTGAYLKSYVLENFSEEELIVLSKTADFAVKLIDCFIENGFQSMLNYYSKNKKSYSETKVSESTTTGGK